MTHAKKSLLTKHGRRSMSSTLPFLLLSNRFIYPSLICSSFSIHNRQPSKIVASPMNQQHQLQQQTSSLPIIFNSIQFDANGTCVTPKLFVVVNSSNEQDQSHEEKYFTMQNVAGDGDCMFLAVAFAATEAKAEIPITDFTPRTAHDDDTIVRTKTEQTAVSLRNMVANVLENPHHVLHVSQNRTIETGDLLQQASAELNYTTSNYITLLRRLGCHQGLYGGGPELTVLCNMYRRPIHVYEIYNDNPNRSHSLYPRNENDQCRTIHIIEKGVFGDGVYRNNDSSILLSSRRNNNNNTITISTIGGGSSNNMYWDLHILVIDVSNNEKHACVLLPYSNTGSTPR